MLSANSYCAQLLEILHSHFPKHPIFGQIEKGQIRAPYEVWHRKLLSLFDSSNMIGENRCLFRSSASFQLTTQIGRKTIVCANVMVVRLLAFLKNPTENNWFYLTGGEALQHPFDHCCNRGQKKNPRDQYCCNGIEHGDFSTRNDNEDRKKCTYGFLARCPGHGPSKSKCIFTNENGTIAKCLMNDSFCPKCDCLPKCY